MSEKKRGYRCKICRYCGRCFEKQQEALKKRPSSFAMLKRSEDNDDLDASTGATPGVSTACSEYGLDDMQAVIKARGIKPPGQS